MTCGTVGAWTSTTPRAPRPVRRDDGLVAVRPAEHSGPEAVHCYDDPLHRTYR
ncbi:hypothetical protein [Aquipuribacter nitratireducens]|uniref:Uncharacterized protein n=1 Tax=Aquipuribacter nitratireducens TaxID=650104 RepID=A0ABW0GNV5_9MICO